MKALEFMTNIPANTDSTEYITQTTDIFTAIPYPLHTINITGSTPAGSDDVFVSGTFSFTDNTYKAIEYSFYFSSMGSTYVGGTLKNVYINLYADAASQQHERTHSAHHPERLHSVADHPAGAYRVARKDYPPHGGGHRAVRCQPSTFGHVKSHTKSSL